MDGQHFGLTDSGSVSAHLFVRQRRTDKEGPDQEHVSVTRWSVIKNFRIRSKLKGGTR